MTTTPEPWDKEFDRKFLANSKFSSTRIWEHQATLIKVFIRTQIAKAKQEERERIKDYASNLYKAAVQDTTYGDTDYDNSAVVYGYNDALSELYLHLASLRQPEDPKQ